MSKIEVDAIEPQSGTTLTVGASGKTIIVPSGATFNASNSTVTLPASAVTAHVTAFDDNKILNDLATLALRQASDSNKSAYNTNSQFVDVFQDDTGIDTTTNTGRDAGEYMSSQVITNTYETGDRKALYSESKNITYGGSDIRNALDGNFTVGNANSWYMNEGSADNTGKYFQYDIGAGNEKIYTGVKMYFESGTTFGSWKVDASNDGSTYTTLYSSFTMGLAGQGSSPYTAGNDLTWTNTTAYRYIRFYGLGGAMNNSNWITEIEFRVGSLSSSATGNFTGTTITAPSSVSSMGAIITYQDYAGTNALNTDIVLQLSADGGSNYSTATLTALPNFATGIKMAKVNDLAVTAGTQLKYKLSFANQASGTKEARIRGVALQY